MFTNMLTLCWYMNVVMIGESGLPVKYNTFIILKIN